MGSCRTVPSGKRTSAAARSAASDLPRRGATEAGEAPPLLIRLRIEPGVRHLVAREVVPDVVAARRPASRQQPEALERRPEVRDPVREQVIGDRVELLLRRIPGLEDVLVEADLVDGADGRIGVGVGRQQHALGIGLQLQGLRQELDAGHPRHALVDDEEADGAASHGELPHDVEPLGAGAGCHDAVVLAVPRAQITLHGTQDGGVVVDGENDGLAARGGHGRSVGRRTPRRQGRASHSVPLAPGEGSHRL